MKTMMHKFGKWYEKNGFTAEGDFPWIFAIVVGILILYGMVHYPMELNPGLPW
jgi:hypothetical protein